MKCALSFILVVMVTGSAVHAEDHFLTIGGGYSPTGNQISLEKNVLFFQRLLDERLPGEKDHAIYFSDGTGSGRDLQFHDAHAEMPRVNSLLARVFQQTRYLGYQYRDHEIPKITGASNRGNLEKWFDQFGKQAKPNDRLFIYVTAHGGRSNDKKKPHDTGLYLWNNYRLPMPDFAKLLDKVPAEVSVVIVMVQCYSGGFADIIFDQGDQAKGLSPANRCGFFATVHDRVAAGCTADIKEEDYHEYSSYFWAAIRGKTRTDVDVPKPDFDNDDQVSFAEAHAYVILNSPTIDIPVKTSDALLRKYSKLERPKDEKKKPQPTDAIAGEDATDATGASEARLYTGDTDYDELFELASAVDQAILEGLSANLNLHQQARAKEAKSLAEQIIKDKRKLEAERNKRGGEYKRIAGEISNHLTQRWPELSNRWDPFVTKILTDHADEVVKAIESHPNFKRFEQLEKETNEYSKKIFDQDRRWVKCQRLVRTLENVALAGNLPLFATEDIQQRYQQLRAAESGLFGVAGQTDVTATE